MRLVCHLVAKDVRRMALPVACWLVLVLAGPLIARCAFVPVDVALSGGAGDWISGLRLIAEVLGVMGLIVTAVLTAFLVQEDPLMGTDAMWLTRPISRGRMLAAKVVAAALMLVVAPLVGLTVIWLSSGFSAGEWMRAAWEIGLGAAVYIMVAGSVAAITRDLGRFIFALIGLTLVALAIGALGLNEQRSAGLEVEVMETRLRLIFWTALAIAPTVGVVQYLTRRTALAWGLLAAGFALMLAIRLVWPWDTLAALPGLSGRWTQGPANRDGPIDVEKLIVAPTPDRPGKTVFRVGALAAKDQVVAPWNGKTVLKWPGGTTVTAYVDRGEQWGEGAMRRLLGLAPAAGAVEWRLTTTYVGPLSPGDLGPTAAMTGEMRFLRMRVRVVAELPWRPGATATNGSASTRIASIAVVPNSNRQVLAIEERDAWFNAISGGGMRGQMREMDDARRDCFAVVNRRQGTFQFLPITEKGTLMQNALLLSERTLEYEPPVRMENGQAVVVPDSDRDAVLVKVRFEMIDHWLAPVAAERMAVGREENKP